MYRNEALWQNSSKIMTQHIPIGLVLPSSQHSILWTWKGWRPRPFPQHCVLNSAGKIWADNDFWLFFDFPSFSFSIADSAWISGAHFSARLNPLSMWNRAFQSFRCVSIADAKAMSSRHNSPAQLPEESTWWTKLITDRKVLHAKCWKKLSEIMKTEKKIGLLFLG